MTTASFSQKEAQVDTDTSSMDNLSMKGWFVETGMNVVQEAGISIWANSQNVVNPRNKVILRHVFNYVFSTFVANDF